MSAESPLDDIRWLVSDQARPQLELAQRDDLPLTRRAAELRKSLSPSRTHLALELADLRRRGQEKFSHAGQMFFTRRAWEQASGEAVARYKAARFAACQRIADLCCGIGGDSLLLSEQGAVAAVDRDPAMVELAAANCRALGRENVAFHAADAANFSVADFDAWHIDPDRRPQGRRTTRLEGSEPSLEVIEQRLLECEHAAIKLAPATEAPPDWQSRAELEWIGHGGECKQQVAWFGKLAGHPGLRSATDVADDGAVLGRVVGRPGEEAPLWDGAADIGAYLYEPSAAVLAAHLEGALARQLDLANVSRRAAYLTGDRLVRHGSLRAFATLAALPLDRKLLKAELQRLGIGRLEVKKRGVEIDPDALRKSLAAPGEVAGVVIVMPGPKGKPLAIVAQRR